MMLALTKENWSSSITSSEIRLHCGKGVLFHDDTVLSLPTRHSNEKCAPPNSRTFKNHSTEAG